MTGIAELAKRGLTSAHIMANWLQRRVQPLKLRSHPAWEYLGRCNPTQEDPSNFTEEEVSNFIKPVFSYLEGHPGDCQVVGFSLENPRSEVSA
jgi:hypothetical protein